MGLARATPTELRRGRRVSEARGDREATPQADRVARLAHELREREVDLLLVNAPVNVRYLTGFTGSNGVALIAADAAAPQRFLTDFRYETQSAVQVPGVFEREIAAGELLEALVRGLGSANIGGGRIGFDDTGLTVKQHARLSELLETADTETRQRFSLVPCGGVVEGLREIKDAEELRRIGAAAELADEALRGVLDAGVVGRTERDVAIELELGMRRLGAEGASFPSIVAAAEHSALPHAEPRDVPIPAGVLLTIDWGAVLDGYCSDCTRTFATGELGEREREVYELVRSAQAQAQAAVRPGPSGRDVDAVAREIIAAAGHGEHFGHGLGHGVGLEVHEAPRLSRTGGEHPLRAGQVVTVEPGVYLPGEFGVRIEDLVIVTEAGGDSLSGLPKELTVIA
jgi:Xaa-Pro aminopeptidase